MADDNNVPIDDLFDPRNLQRLAEFCRGDADGIMAAMVHARMEQAGLLAALNLVYVPPAEPTHEFPADWTAFQIGLFDNGSQLDKRGRERSTKTRFALSIKVWCALDPDFKAAPNWSATCALWSRRFAIEHLPKLQRRGSISEGLLLNCMEALEQVGDEWRFGIPLLRPSGRGSQYLAGHRCYISFAADRPVDGFIFGHGFSFEIEKFSEVDPAGRRLTGNAVAAARITRSISLPRWETQTLGS